jgi:DNA-binding NarL/FixJ family response regulator
MVIHQTVSAGAGHDQPVVTRLVSTAATAVRRHGSTRRGHFYRPERPQRTVIRPVDDKLVDEVAIERCMAGTYSSDLLTAREYEVLKATALESGLSQYEIAEILQVDQRYVCRWKVAARKALNAIPTADVMQLASQVRTPQTAKQEAA